MAFAKETKLGLFAALAIGLLFFGIQFFKGNWPGNSIGYLAVVDDAQGLAKNSSVTIKGMAVGTVTHTAMTKDMRRILITLQLEKNIRLPVDTKIRINKSLLGNVQAIIEPGLSAIQLKPGDTIATQKTAGFWEEMKSDSLYQQLLKMTEADSILIIPYKKGQPTGKAVKFTF